MAVNGIGGIGGAEATEYQARKVQAAEESLRMDMYKETMNVQAAGVADLLQGVSETVRAAQQMANPAVGSNFDMSA